MAKWKSLKEMAVLGKEYPRVDGPDKVTGDARYTYDVQLVDMLWAKVVRSPHPHARIISIDTSKAEAMDGVKAVWKSDRDEINYAGDEVAAVAAVSENIAYEAAMLVKVEYENLPFVVDEQKARQPDAPRVFSNREDNLGQKRENTEGDVEKGFQESDVILERTFHLNVQVHNCLETHGCVATWKDDDLYIYDSTQGVHSIRRGVARNLKMPENRVHVICPYMGGGFGSKLGTQAYHTIAAKLSRQAQRPVKLMLTREDELVGTGNRPSSYQNIKLGAKKDGTLVAFELESFGTGGIGGGAGVPLPYVYHVPNIHTVHHDVFVNAGFSAPMRAPGHPQAAWGMESMMDELADELGLDPLEVRKKNDPNQTRQKEFEIAAEKFGWNNRKKGGIKASDTKRRGMGIGVGRWGGGGTTTQALLSIYPDGSLDVKIGTQDIGTGTRTIIAGVLAEEFGLTVQEVVAYIGKSDYPIAPSSGGSRTAPSVCPTTKLAAEKAKEQLYAMVAKELDVPADDLMAKESKISSMSDPSKSLTWQQACKLLRNPITVLESWQEGLSDSGTAGCEFAEVEVDIETGHVEVLRVTAVHDCGLPVNMLTAHNQIKGGIIGAISYAMFEDRIMNNETGHMVNAEMDNYKIAGALEMPEFDVTIIDESERGVIGLGEPPAIPGPAAIVNAVSNALGVRINENPITPDKVLMALAEKEGM